MFSPQVEKAKAEIGANIRTGGAHVAGLPSARQLHSVYYVWYAVCLLAIVNACNYIDRMALGVLAPLIKVDLDLTDTQLGLLTGFAFAVFYGACAIPIARWADRGIRRNIIAWALTAWSAMTVLCGAAQNFWHLFLARVGVGAGEAGSYAPGASIVCDYVPLKRRSGAIAVHVFGNSAGILGGMALAGWLGQAIGWRWTFVVLGLPGIALALIVRFTLREPARGLSDVQEGERSALSLGETLKFLWRCRTYRLLCIFLAANGFVQFGLNQWWPSFYMRVFGADLSAVGVYLGIALGAGAGIGMLIGGLMANKIMIRDVRLPLAISAVITSLSLPAALGSLFVSSMEAAVPLVFLTGLFWGVSSGPVLAAQYSVVRARMRATAGAISIFFISVLGFGLGPFCVGLLSDLLAVSFGAQSLRYALILPVSLTPVMVLAMFAAAKSLPLDLKAIGYE